METVAKRKKRAQQVYDWLSEAYPGVKTFLAHESPFQLLIATILSAQCTDERVNKVTPELFQFYPDCATFAKAEVDHIAHLIRSIHFFNTKAKNCVHTARILLEAYQGEVPPQLEALVKLPGVGRKTANVVLGQAFDIPGITVDTHVKRLVKRMGYTAEEDPVKIEKDLMTLWPKAIWSEFSTVLIVHGRKVCHARVAQCDSCGVSSFCPRIGVSSR